ncbi:MAG TPA: hypothetical protein VN642_15630 [Dongiaceae bacterium]|nr:hypothetical protein [Dongiaceae bacterium]
MTTVSKQIQNVDEAICRNIESLADQRALLSQNVLSQLRNLVEGVAVRLYTGSPDAEFNYAEVEPDRAMGSGFQDVKLLKHFLDLTTWKPDPTNFSSCRFTYLGGEKK